MKIGRIHWLQKKSPDLYISKDNSNFKIENNFLLLNPKEEVSFKAYNNLIPINQMIKYSSIESFDILFQGSGSCKVRIFSFPENTFLSEHTLEIDSNLKPEININLKDYSKYSYIYLNIEAITNLKMPSIEIHSNDFIKRNCKLALIICTYKREEYVK